MYLVCPTCGKAIPYAGLIEQDIAMCDHCSSTTLQEFCENSGSIVVNFKSNEKIAQGPVSI